MAEAAPALKEWFNEPRFRQAAAQLASIEPAFDRRLFLKLALPDLEELSLMQRLRRMTECLKAALPQDYRMSLGILRQWAPRIDHSFVTLVLADFVGVYGHDDFEESLSALQEFTCYGSAEFAIREFLKRDLSRTLKVMQRWSRDRNEHVRRLASEGCRPRLPWSFRLEALVNNPEPVRPILDHLKADPSLYVRKSVANHLNDISKDHPDWVLDVLHDWGMDHPHTAWIAKRALRTLIKQGHREALAFLGAGHRAEVTVSAFKITPETLNLGETIEIRLDLVSTMQTGQRLMIDYVIHYVKKAGGRSAKVFKWKEVIMLPGASLRLAKRQRLQNFTTRIHHSGKHLVEIMINGHVLAQGAFTLNAGPQG